MIHGHVEHIVELDSILSDMMVIWHGVGILSADHTECHETFVFKILNSFSKLK